MKLIIFLLSALVATSATAWSGYDYERGTFVDIEKGNLVRPGRDIEIYDYQGGYREVEVQSIRRVGSSVEVEVVDRDTGDVRTLEMDGR
jgi:hypothetical protein